MSQGITGCQAVAFDLDGTLVDSIADLAAAANAMRRDLGLPDLSQARIQGHVGGGVVSLVHRALTDARDGRAHDALFQEGFARFQHWYDAMLADATRPFPGVLEGLNALREAGIPLACVTNKSSRFTLPLLQKTGLSPYFELVVCGDTLAEKKPHPLPLLHTAATLGVAVTRLLLVGDSHYDVAAARAAGAPVVVVDYGYEPAQGLGADAVIDSFLDLPPLLAAA